MRRKLLPIAFLMLASMFVAAQRAGRITGLVLNEDGQTADHATV
jgi:hypothetical protein